MQTHPVQFGRHVGSAGHAHAHSEQIGGQFVTPHAKSSGNAQHDALVKQTEKWVSQTFYGEMLKQMRNSPFKNKMFEGGQGGEAFNQMFDAKLADKMSKGAGKKLVDSIVNKIEKAKNAYGATARTTKVSHKPNKAHSTPAFLANMGMTR
jgi:Rod binding domain-containing protein